MLIDSLAVKKSAAVGRVAGTHRNPLIDQSIIIEALSDLLVSVGWTRTAVYATGTISYPLSLPIASPAAAGPPLVTVGCGRRFIELDGVHYVLYDPYVAVPLAGAPCVFVALGDTAADTAANLASALTRGRWVASWSEPVTGQFVITVTALGGGSTFNYVTYAGDGAYGVGSGRTDGGGWIFTSAEERDGSGNLRTASYSVKVTGSGIINTVTGHLTRPIHFDFGTDFNGYGTALLTLDSLTYTGFDEAGPTPFGAVGEGYTMVANPYSFAIWCPSQPDFTSIFAAAPYIPTEEGFTSAYGVMAACPVFTATSWNDGMVALDGPAQTYLLQAHPELLAVRSPGTQPLLTPSGAALITSAYVMFGRNFADTPAVIGKLWDCAVVNDVVTGSMIAGQAYVTIASQAGAGGQTRSSLVFRVN